jgi:glucose uptake protein
MILPATYLAAVLLLTVSLLCWGSWASTYKLLGKWRFELYYYDFALGVALCAVAAAFTLGSMNSQDLTFQDNLLITEYRKIAEVIAGGVVFNLGNMFLLAAVAVSGLALAFPMAMGAGLVIGVVWNYANTLQGNPLLLFPGILLVIAAMVMGAFAYSSYEDAQIAVAPKPRPSDPAPAKAAGAKPGPTKPGPTRTAQARQEAPRTPAAVRKPAPYAPQALAQTSTARAVVLSLASGLLLGLYSPLLNMARAGEDGVASYSAALLFGAGILFSTFFFGAFFTNFPVQGQPLEMRAYFEGSLKQHVWSLAGGVIWMIGMLAALTASEAPAPARVSAAASFGFAQGPALVAALWGLFVWREFRGSSRRVKGLLTGVLLLFAAGVAMVAVAPLYRK